MAKKENNNGTVIFWGVIIAVIIIILLIVFIPRTNSVQGFNRINDLKISVNTTDTHSKNLEYYTDTLDSSSLGSTTNKAKLNSLKYIQTIIEYSTNFNLNALCFCATNNSLLKQQASFVNKANNYLQNMQDFCDETLYSFIQSSSFNESFSFNEMLNVFINQYYEPFIIAYANTYITTANLIDESATRCMEINDTSVSANTEIMNNLKTIIEAENLNASAITTLLGNAYEKYNSTYYQTYWEGE